MAATKPAIPTDNHLEANIETISPANTAFDIVDQRGIIDLEFLRQQDQGAASVIAASLKKIDELDDIKKCITLATNKVYAELRVQTGINREAVAFVRKMLSRESESRTVFLQDVALVSQVAQLELPLALSKHGQEKSVTAKLKGSKKAAAKAEDADDAVTGAALED